MAKYMGNYESLRISWVLSQSGLWKNLTSDDENDVDNDDEGYDDLHLLQGVKRGEQACHLLHLDKKGVIVLLCNQRNLLDFSQILPGFWEQRLAGSSGRSHLKAFPSPTPSL